jgi:hypothetical protein
MKETVKDYWDNENTQQMIVVEVVPDEEPPAVDKIEVKEENKIDITFTEDLADDADDKDNFTILDDKGDEVKNIIKTAKLDGKKITITFKENLSGDYSIVIENVKDKADNKMDKTTVPFTVGDITPPNHEKFTATLYNHDDVDQMLKISFGDTMATEGKYSVTDVEKYVIISVEKDNEGNITKETEYAKLEDIKDVEIDVVDDGKSVEIYIPSFKDVDEDSDLKHKEDYLNLSPGQYVKIARVADAADNKMTVMTVNVEIKASDTIGVDTENVKATARNTIEITFKDNVTAFEAEDIRIQVGKDDDGKPKFLDHDKDIAGVSTKLNDDGNTVAVFTLDDDILAYNVEDDGNEVFVWIMPAEGDEIKSENRYGNKLTEYKEGAKIKVKDKIAPELYSKADVDYAKEAGADAYVGDVLKIKMETVAEGVYGFAGNFTATIYFSEEIKVASEVLAGSDFIITLDGDKLDNGIDYQVIDYGINSDGVGYITFAIVGEENKAKNVYELIGDLEIGRVEKPLYVTDVKGNKIADFDTIELDDLVLPKPSDD